MKKSWLLMPLWIGGAVVVGYGAAVIQGRPSRGPAYATWTQGASAYNPMPYRVGRADASFVPTSNVA